MLDSLAQSQLRHSRHGLLLVQFTSDKRQLSASQYGVRVEVRHGVVGQDGALRWGHLPAADEMLMFTMMYRQSWNLFRVCIFINLRTSQLRCRDVTARTDGLNNDD